MQTVSLPGATRAAVASATSAAGTPDVEPSGDEATADSDEGADPDVDVDVDVDDEAAGVASGAQPVSTSAAAAVAATTRERVARVAGLLLTRRRITCCSIFCGISLRC